MTNNKGQNAVEYVLLVVAVLVVLIVFLKKDGVFDDALEHSLFEGNVKHINSLSDEIKFK